MPDAKFNAYTQWLGIPPAELPPTHYRLLGVAAFESNPQVIDVAARKLAALVKSKAVEPHVGAAKKLLIELAAARTCLLDKDTKAEYDKSLPETASKNPPAGTPLKRAIPIRPAASPPRRSPGPAPAPARGSAPPVLNSGSAQPTLDASNSLPWTEESVPEPPLAASSKIGSSSPRKPTVVTPANSQPKPSAVTARASANHAPQPMISRKEKAKRSNRMALYAAGGLGLLGIIIVAVILLRANSSPPLAIVDTKPTPASLDKPKVADSSSKAATNDAKPTAAAKKVAALPVVSEETPSTLFEAIDASVTAPQMAKLLDGPAAQFIDAQDRNRNNRTPLRMAVKRGRADLVKLLIQHRANVNLADALGETPLMSAAQTGDAAMVAALLEAKALVNAQTLVTLNADDNEPDKQPHGVTALSLAAANGKTEVVKLLLKNSSITVDLADRQGATPLMVAAWKGHADIVKALLDAGANCNYADRVGETVLMFAVDGQNLPVVDLLLRAGANVDASNQQGLSSKQMADDIGNAQIIKRLSEGKNPT